MKLLKNRFYYHIFGLYFKFSKTFMNETVHRLITCLAAFTAQYLSLVKEMTFRWKNIVSKGEMSSIFTSGREFVATRSRSGLAIAQKLVFTCVVRIFSVMNGKR
ncbi:Uncharacterised protein r2_g1171 [Pycnogonum litorale]